MYFTAEEKVQIYYDDVGSGAPVVMIHGAATSSKVYDGLTSRMVAQFRCIRLDLRGLGRSDRVDAVSPTAWCDDTMALMDHLGIDKAHLLGCSLGARIAGRLVLDHPGRFETLTVDAPLVAVAQAANSRLNTRFSNLDNPDPIDRRRHGQALIRLHLLDEAEHLRCEGIEAVRARAVVANPCRDLDDRVIGQVGQRAVVADVHDLDVVRTGVQGSDELSRRLAVVGAAALFEQRGFLGEVGVAVHLEQAALDRHDLLRP